MGEGVVIYVTRVKNVHSAMVSFTVNKGLKEVSNFFLLF